MKLKKKRNNKKKLKRKNKTMIIYKVMDNFLGSVQKYCKNIG